VKEFRVAIVGSRRRASLEDRQFVLDLVERLVRFCDESKKKLILISGGCRTGGDFFAEEAAKVFDVPIIVHGVSTDPPIKHRGEFRERAFARNRLIAQDCHGMYALVSSDRSGGTENSLSHMRDLGKKYRIIDESGRILKDEQRL
jgi:hypothetical protein